MNSKNVEQSLGLDPLDWKPLDALAIKQSPHALGVYVIKVSDGKAFGRLRGESDVIYIGSGVIRNRIRAHSRPSIDLRNKGWLLSLFANISISFSVAWVRCDNCERQEHDLLYRYLKDHLELPPANRNLRLTEIEKSELTALVSLMDLAHGSGHGSYERAQEAVEAVKKLGTSSERIGSVKAT